MTNKIVCPFCGREYLLAEIFLPQAILGKPESISRDFDGKIIAFEGSEPDMSESYCCDNCNNIFDVTIDMNITTSYKEPEEEYCTPLLKPAELFNT